MPLTVSHALSATTPDEIRRAKQREANRRSYYKHVEKRRAYYRDLAAKKRQSDPDAYNEYQRKMQTKYRRMAGVPAKHFNTPDEAKRKRAAEYARWSKANPHKTAALAAARRAKIKNATPAWANKKEIEKIYFEAARLTKETGIPHEVDHYYPIKSRVVCGLHCEANLRVITAEENMKKGNKCPSR